MDATAERSEDADPPVAYLVAEALDHDRAVGRDRAGRRLLLPQECEEVVGGSLVKRVLLCQARHRLLVAQRGKLPRGASDRLAELVRAPGPLALPERDRTRYAGRRRDEH